ncbi:ABC transporter ATP-binding protein [Marinimicrobium sp. ABcell2]|uniref:ABC transporter ATP-binding protein n=1 Tax=Marinimicrobium sp. ABcell2 TaxID=3069751 RepID=UPI0027B75D8D|nr:ABC transporter ATP-binding protein [Marinimicrobium sp. ABcell2]MDQ2078338.1 ABC transporter ATP-binding protein [Marinimicrobium sp. ABcell2]
MSDGQILLSAKDLEFEYSSRVWGFKRLTYPVLKGMTFDVRRGETLGIVGRNGCGKSSLLRILNGVIAPTGGTLIEHKGMTRILLTLGLGFDVHLTGRDNAMLSAMLQGYSRERARASLEDIKEFSELGDFFERPVKMYSSGMRSRLGFSTAMKTEVDLLLIDETLSVGDQNFNRKAEKAMMEKINSDQTVIFVSHSGKQVNKVCSRAIWLEDGQIKAEGDTKSVAREYKQFMDALSKQGGKTAWAS